jgi:ApaG protein
MQSKISSGIIISVETFYQQEYSNPKNHDFMFAYKITIKNENNFSVKLLSRYWHIFDSNGIVKEVEGEGVVGIQPVIQPSEKYQYVSGCNLKSEFGRIQKQRNSAETQIPRELHTRQEATTIIITTRNDEQKTCRLLTKKSHYRERKKIK